ncbi:adenylyl-sulfate kinase [Reichenbachiella versicolor]|uniref:adenylyl-sulfate kinase n=1 Tax=Reichenbachiella versicolor TaxID=1821036 RepID=UPI000D6E2315|nr:adenylyl-sulfate kinase [Reichenbachiella versicolor]
MTKNIVPHRHTITRADRVKKRGYEPILVWLVGLSGSGKSTLANALEEKLFKEGLNTYLLDGDNVRSGLNRDLGFSDEDRKENIRRITEVAKLFMDSGTIVISAFITPFEKDRQRIRAIVGTENFVEVFVKCPIEECEKRDVKGLYAKARRGEIKSFTGIDSPFEEPVSADVIVESHKVTIEKALEAIYKVVKEKISINE